MLFVSIGVGMCFSGRHGTELRGVGPYLASAGLKPVACSGVAW